MALKYGVQWVEGANDFHIELMAFRDGTARYGGDPDNRPFHFKNVVKVLYGPKSKKHYVWNPWADKMLAKACEYNYLLISGCASSGKSTFGAVWGLVNWLCQPGSTLVLFTSTGLGESRRRVWGEVEDYFMAGCESLNAIVKGNRLPGRILSSTGKIVTDDSGQKFSDRCGLQLIAGDRAKEKENIGKLIGAHNKRVILIADELTELSPALVEAAQSNLAVNPFFQMIGMGNFASIYDPFGVNAEPLGGWGSVTPDFDEWPTKNGLCLRFDGLKAPNILAGSSKYPGQYDADDLENHRKSLGENSASFWRMCRSFPCPEADADRIYSEADLLKGEARALVKWSAAPVKVASLDPAFATGGDRAMAYFGELGNTIDGKQTLQVTERVELREDIRKKDENRALQVAKLFRDECIKRGVAPQNAAYDASGGGIVFGSLLSELWSHKLLGVQFGGNASDRPASVKDHRPAKEAFVNRVAEIWFAGVDFIQSGQIKGLPAQACVELTERRRLVAAKGATGLKLKIESKVDMKGRTGGKSPDDADSFLILLELCRLRLDFKAVGMEGKRAGVKLEWKQKVLLANRVYANSNYTTPELAAG
jgi:hypothetical protein